MSTRGYSRRGGFSLVELLASIAIIAILAVLLLAAVQAARETARRTQCQSHLRQLGLAALTHESALGHYPTDGWGWRWVGDADRGYDRQQPGGWVYNILAFIEQGELRALGQGQPADLKRAAAETLVTTPLVVLHCPSRRSADLYPFTAADTPINCRRVERAAKSDYACSAGTAKVDTGTGPIDLTEAAMHEYKWPDTRGLNGLIHAFSEVREADVLDGASKTYLLGEKYLASDEYYTGWAAGGDDQTAYLGDDADVRRWSFRPPLPDGVRESTRDPFGSAHSGGCYFVMADGAVRLVSYDIDEVVHASAGNRRDSGAR